MDSCKDYLKNQIFTAIKTAFANMKQKSAILITDDRTTMILDSCMKVHHLNNRGIGAIVNVKYRREKLMVPPIYFLSPTIESIKGLVTDWEDPQNPQYDTCVHLWFCSSITKEGMELLKKSKLRGYLKTFQEVYCDFNSLESRVYHFDRPSAFRALYVDKQMNEEIRKTTENLFSVCVSLNEEPYIRYYKDSTRATSLAQMLSICFGEKRKLMKTFKPRRKRATLLILDRSQDPVAPLLHEMTYQSMIKDLIKGENRYLNLPNEGATNSKEEKTAEKKHVQFIFAEDPLWEEFRHKNMVQVCSEIRLKFQEFKDTNIIAKSMEQKGHTENLMKAVKDLPKYKRMSTSFNFHLQITSILARQHKRMSFANITHIEQTMVTGLDDNGRSVKTSVIHSVLLNMFKDPTVSMAIKLRLLLVYMISSGGISETMRNDLFTAANLSSEDAEVILHLRDLGVKIKSDSKKTKKPHNYKEIQNRAKELIKSKKNESRCEPLMALFLRKLGKEKLSEEDFPYCGSIPEGRGLVGSFGGRIRKGNVRVNEVPRIIIFMIGGVCYSEIRQCYLLGEELHRDIFIGSTHTLTPSEYIQLLRGTSVTMVD